MGKHWRSVTRSVEPNTGSKNWSETWVVSYFLPRRASNIWRMSEKERSMKDVKRTGRERGTNSGRTFRWLAYDVRSLSHSLDWSIAFFHLNHTKKRQGDFVAVSVCRSVRSTVFQFKTRSVVTAQTWKKIVSLPLTAKHGLDRISKRTSGTIQYGHKFSGSVRWS